MNQSRDLPRAVLLDANLLVLLTVGSTEKSYIGKHRRLRAYTENDFDILLGFIEPISTIIVTPNILTEASNLASQTPDPAKSRIAATFRSLVKVIDEHYVDSKIAVDQPEFNDLWLTDCGVLVDLNQTVVLLTADLDLYLRALSRGYAAVNFNHLRGL